MKNYLATLGILLIIAAVGWQFKNKFFSTPCAEPTPYNLGTFDTKFNISKKYFLDAITEAEAIWEKPSGLDLFVYQPEDSSRDVLKINLVYDYRQQATSKLKSLGIEVSNTRASYDSLKEQFEKLRESYEVEKAQFEEKIAKWNRGPRNNRSEFEELQSMQDDLNEKADEINAMVVALNRLVATLNLSVEKYNTVNTARGESFEEGVFYSDGTRRSIDIYEFSSREKLLRVLAHEFGHALDLPHVADSKAIMYELNQGNTLKPTQADLAALRAKCAE